MKFLVLEPFFAALNSILSRGLHFRLALLGESFQTVPKPFLDARAKYRDRIVQYGYVPQKREYVDILKKGLVVISTAIQDNFGISVAEAVRVGCYPLLPKRLSYPELIPGRYHKDCLYESQDELIGKLSLILADPNRFQDKRLELAAHMGRYAWEVVIDDYDEELRRLAENKST